jgi:hypothetical protein
LLDFDSNGISFRPKSMELDLEKTMNLTDNMKRQIRLWRQRPEPQPAPAVPPDKAHGGDFLGRIREVVSDPLNLLIERDPRAGMVEDGFVWLHNGNRVPFEGQEAYYGRFSELLVINRGVHEPLEEFVYQELMRRMPEEPMMLELGAYWGHYSMWMKRVRPRAKVFLVEPIEEHIKIGQANFNRHGYEGNFIRSLVCKQHFGVDRFLEERDYRRLDILHSDIQSYEVEMLEGCVESFRHRLIDYVFVSTHSQVLHDQVVASLSAAGMRVEISSGFDEESTSYDGFVFAIRAELPEMFPNFSPIGRREILQSKPEKLVSYLSTTLHEVAAQTA